ncbi:beta-ketoacyl-ACP reductase [Bordetella genomosp. 1]|uniref:Beta-ketoacyl-ACP reductase n=1 Tax=Bordetella genomosp. 1 TaxID=1395607 RepID=A0A261S778_9BORD|nr:beta-ketoacyl-ACP reductase [Bordetella genomosp. 1]
MDFGINGQVALVTGAANGIGKAIARGLAQEGCRVAVLDRDGASADVAALEITDGGGQALAIAVDVTKPDSVAKSAEIAARELGGLHIVVNCAGFSKDSPVSSMTDDQWQSVLDVTLNGAFNMIRAVAPMLREQRYGRIINITSRAHFGDVNKANYSSAKAGLIGLTKALSLELAPEGITVNAVAPGIIETERLRALPYFKGIEERSKAGMPIKRFGTVEEVAALVAFLASAQAGFISGEVVHISGGRYG